MSSIGLLLTISDEFNLRLLAQQFLIASGFGTAPCISPIQQEIL